MAVVVLVGGGIFAWVHFGKSKPKSAEDQIRSVVQREIDYENNSDFSWRPELECKANQASDQADADKNRQLIAKTGRVSIVSLTNIKVTGDTATADLTVTFAKVPLSPTTSLKFVNEGGTWKDCTPPDTSDDSGGGDSGG